MRGFTLVEMLATIALVAIVLTLAVPSFTAIINNNRLTSAANELLYDILLARSEAIKREARATICKKTADSANCTTSGDWTQGWLVFVDNNANAQVNAGEPIVAVNEGPSGDVTISGDTDVADYISFVSTGRSRMNDGSAQDGTLTLTVAGKSREIAVSTSGRALVKE